MTVTFAPDTNFFLQCNKIEEIDWKDVTSDEEIVLIVLKEVQRELDRHKSGGNARRAKRARDISARLRSIIRHNVEAIVLREQEPKVVLRLAPRLASDRPRPVELDLSIADERIVEEALACQVLLNSDLCLLTNDMAPLQTARDLGLSATPIPDNWLLSPEPNDMEKELQRLKRQLEGLIGKSPSIQVLIRQEGTAIVKVEASVQCFAKLSSDFVEHALSRIQAALPMKSREAAVDELNYVSIQGLSEYHEKYQQWSVRLRDRLEAVPTMLNILSGSVRCELVLSNVGSASAEHLVVDIRALGPIQLVDEPALEQITNTFKTFLPAPPEFINEASRRSRFTQAAMKLGAEPAFPSPLVSNVARAPREFYWAHGQALDKCWQGECADFRHGMNPHTKEVLLRSALGSSSDNAGALEIRISAKNMVEPSELIIPVRLRCEVVSSEDRAAELILREFGVRV